MYVIDQFFHKIYKSLTKLFHGIVEMVVNVAVNI